jgi:branched-subunit amino acid transport protein AzlD
MALIGKLETFCPATENITNYFVRMEAFFSINSITEANMVKALIAVLGAEVYSELCTLCLPDKPNTKTFAVLEQLLVDHYKPALLNISQRNLLSVSKQKETEFISDFVSELRKLAATCGFATSERLN